MDDVLIVEVGPRDGLQNEKNHLSTPDKIKYIELLAKSGLKYIEATSFVRPGVIAQLSDSSDVVKNLDFKKGIVYSALVPNLKGMEAALKSGIPEIAVFTAASESFTKKNINASIPESMERIRDVVKVAQDNRLKIRAYISTIIECPYEGLVEPRKVDELVHELLDLGVYQISLGETIGTAVPDEVSRLLDRLCKRYDTSRLALHFHDTRGTALANVFRSLEYGIRVFDASSAGLGGCPYAPGAAGNLATEDLVYALERSSYSTHVDLDKLVQASDFVLQKLQKKSVSRVYNARQA